MRRALIRLVQLPLPPPAAFGATGNGALAPGALAVAARVHRLSRRFDVEVVPPAVADSLGDAALARQLAKDGPAAVGFSLYLWNIERSIHLARLLKRLSPETVTLAGGPECCPGNQLVECGGAFDLAVTGEGEIPFAAVLSRLPRLPDPGEIPGVAVSASGRFARLAPPRLEGVALSRYPSPYLAGILPVSADRSVYLETARGCGSRCSFCFYSRRKTEVRALGPAALATRSRRLADAGAAEIYLLDPSFNRRHDLRAVLEGLARANRARRLSFFCELRAERLTGAVLDLMARAGFAGAELGLQSVNRDTLRRARRGGSPEAVVAAAKGLKERGISPQVDLIVGLPGDRAGDVRRGLDFLVDHGLAGEAQVLPLLVLPGTAIRERAAEEGVLFDPLPPYRVIRTRDMDEQDMAEALAHAEDALGRDFFEHPRPHLVSAEGAPGTPDVFRANLDREEPRLLAALDRPGARHCALWLAAKDPWRRRVLAARAIEARLAADPFSTLDVVVHAEDPFPLDLIDVLRKAAETGPQWYLTRTRSGSRQGAARRVCVVLERRAQVPADWIAAAAREVPVFRDATWHEALRDAERLGFELPAARVLGVPPEAGGPEWLELARRADPESVAFASRALEAKWTREVLGYADLSPRADRGAT